MEMTVEDGPMPTANARKTGPWLMLACTLILAISLLFQAFGKSEAPKGSVVSGQLGKRLPVGFAGWQTQDLPIGANEVLRNRTNELLQFDDYIYRQYSRGTLRLAVYAAYWAPGKMPTRLVATHTPDRCWTENGWKCIDQKFGVPVSTEASISRAQWRIFRPPLGDDKEYVFFWLLVGGQPYDFGQRLNTVPDPVQWWWNVVQDYRHGSYEQTFIRITSNRPFDAFEGEPAWEEILHALAKFGAEPAPQISR
jgi:hypothetical protein